MAARNTLYRKAMKLINEHLDGKEDSDARAIVHQLLKDRSLKVIEWNNTKSTELCGSNIIRHLVICNDFIWILLQGYIFPGGYVGRTSSVEIDHSACNENIPDCDEVQDFYLNKMTIL